MGPNFWPVLCVHIHHPVLFCTQRRRSHFFSPHFSPYLPCFAPLSRIERLSLHCSPNWKIMDLINWSLNAIDTIFGFRGTWLPRRNVRSGLYDGRVGEVANRVSCGSFRGGHWRYLPIRNHDNRYFADWIRLCPGLSKNSEDGNSCPKPHKAARLDWSCGKSGQHWDWDYQSQYGFYQGVAHGFTKENVLYWRPKWTESVACKIGMHLLAPKTKQSYLFLAPPHSGLGKAVAGIYPGRAMQLDALASSPHPTDIQTLPLPRPLASVRFEPPACQAGLTSAGLVAAGPDGCLLGRIHFPCGYVVCLWCMCFCVAEVFFLFSHCTPQGA